MLRISLGPVPARASPGALSIILKNEMLIIWSAERGARRKKIAQIEFCDSDIKDISSDV